MITRKEYIIKELKAHKEKHGPNQRNHRRSNINERNTSINAKPLPFGATGCRCSPRRRLF